MSAQDRGWGPPCQSGKMRTWVRADGLRWPVHAELRERTRILCDRTEAMGYDLKPGWCWGYACRKVSGTNTWSNHAWGLAVDLNAPVNPYASADWHRRNARGTMPFGLQIVCDMPEPMIAMWEDAGYRWGGRYRNKPDPMHYEYMGTPAHAAETTERLRPGGPMAEQLDRIESQLNGKMENSLRHYIRDQDRRTRELTQKAHEDTRTTVGWLIAQLKEDLTVEHAAMIARIEELADGGADGPVTITAADRRAIAETVATVTGDKLTK